MIIETPLTQEQLEKLQSVSDKQLREAQDALFLWLITRINELEERLGKNLRGD